MKSTILLLMLLFFFTACETGTRYEKNTTVTDVNAEEEDSIFVNRRIKDLIDEEEETEESVPVESEQTFVENEEEVVSDLQSFSGGVHQNGLDVRQIREGRHGDGVRLVFDIYKNNQPASSVGAYKAQYSASRDEIAVLINGYQKFSAPLPSFTLSSPIEQIYFKTSIEKESYKFHIKLRKKVKVRVSSLPNPARLIVDIKPH